MPVFNVSCTYKSNGVKRSGPIVANNSKEALEIASARWDASENDPEFQWTVEHRPDPEGTYERMLKEAETRRLSYEAYDYYSMPVTTRRRR